MAAKARDKKKGAKNSIKVQLIATMLLLTAVPIILLTAISYVISMRNAESNAEEINLLQAELAEDDFIEVINESMRAIQAVAGNPGTRDFIKMSEEERAGELDRMAAYLAGIDDSLGDTNSTVISDSTGENIARSRGSYTNVGERDYFLKAIGGTVYLSDVIVSKTSGSRIIVPAVPVYDDDGKTVIGVVTRNFDLNVLHDFLATQTAGTDIDIFIVDRDGDVVADSAKEISADEDNNRSSSAFFTMAQNNDSGTYIDSFGGARKIVSYWKESQTSWVVVVSRSYDDTMAHAMQSAMISVVIGIIALVVAGVIAFVMANGFVAPIFAVNASLEKLSDGQFMKVEDPKFKKRNDEFGDMIRETNSVIDKLDEIVRSIKESAVSVGASSQELAETTNQISQTADDVSNAVQEIATGATQQADEIQHATENTNTISDNILDVTNNATGLEGTAQNMNGNSQDSVAQLEKLRKSSEQMKVVIDDISEKIGATSKAVENINSKVAAINSIASQTNLLALNASIEAARAGEAGKGFAVVAEEIGKLADDSAVSANEIRSEMEVLLSESQAAVEQADHVRQTTEEQSEILAATVESVNKLIEDISTTVAGVRGINQAAELCTESKTVVVDAMSSLSAISEENAAASEETSASMQELNATVNTLAFAADQLKDIAEKLNSEIAFFK